MATDPARMSQFAFQLKNTDRGCGARTGRLLTPHGVVDTPAFMPVGTQGTVKGLEVGQLRQTGSQMILGNTYHLAIRPGADVVRELGGLHQFSGWDGPILTDSGGFQIFSLADQTQVNDEGVVFRSHVDGRRIELPPERAVEIQESLGSDVAMVLDHVVKLPSPPALVEDACRRTVLWAKRCRDAQKLDRQALFAIVQGGLDADLRVRCAAELVQCDFPGYAVGGLSVGESAEEMCRVLDVTCPELPANRPRYLMGVGRPEDLLAAISRGIDLFDCVMPTRNGRNALAFTDQGTMRLRNQQYRLDQRPLEENCPCAACRRSRGYVRHLFNAGEMLGPILLSLHNLTYYQRLVRDARQAIAENRFRDFHDQKRRGWATADSNI